MMPSKMVIATILSSAARAIAIFLLSLLLKLNDDLYWVLPWLRQMTIRIEVVFFIFLIQCGGSSRGAPSIHVASLSPTRVYCFHFNCAIVVAAAAASKAAAGGYGWGRQRRVHPSTVASRRRPRGARCRRRGAQHDSAHLGGLTTVLFGELLVVLGSDLRI